LVTGALNVSLAPDANDIEDLVGNDLAPLSWSYTVTIDVNMEDFETAGFTKFPWVRTGNVNWYITSANKHGGTYSAKAGTITHSQSSSLAVTLTCVTGNITFWRKTSSESGFDGLQFYIDGVSKGVWSGETAWGLATYAVTAGSRTFTWTYSKNASLSSGSDTAWLDDIAFPRAKFIDADAPTASITLDDPTPTGADVVHFSVDFSENVKTSFDASDVTLTGTLSGTPVVSGTNPNYRVAVTLSDPDDDGTVGINVGTAVTEKAGKPYVGGSSLLYTIIQEAPVPVTGLVGLGALLSLITITGARKMRKK
jgi:hypothetical protein